MTRVEIDIKGKIDASNNYDGELDLRIVREFGENSTEENSASGKIETVVAKSLEQYLKGFIPYLSSIIESTSKSVNKAQEE